MIIMIAAISIARYLTTRVSTPHFTRPTNCTYLAFKIPAILQNVQVESYSYIHMYSTYVASNETTTL